LKRGIRKKQQEINMLSFSRVATAIYALVIFTAGYMGVVTVHGFLSETARMQERSMPAALDHTVLVMDRIEPSAATK
jgi:hypothetical protein